MSKLLNIDKNAKTVKGVGKGYQTGILYLSPANESGVANTCPFSSPGCRATCLNTAGMGIYNNVQAARAAKTREYFENRESFMTQLEKEIQLAVRLAKRKGLTPVFRLNGTSDMPALALRMVDKFPEIQFYDYSKIPKVWERVRPNYHLTFSRSESNWRECVAALSHGINVAVVFSYKCALPLTWRGYKVIDGDETDLRFLDPAGVIVGLRAKGKARRDRSGFVVDPNEKKYEGNELNGLPVIRGNF